LLANGLLFVTGSRKLFNSSMKTLWKWEQPVLARLPFLQKYCWTALLVFRKDPHTGEVQGSKAGA